MGPLTFVNCMCEFPDSHQIYLFLLFALLFLILLFSLVLTYILQICVIDLNHVGLGMKEAIQIYFSIHEFQLDDFL
jgi:hypothetical protein